MQYQASLIAIVNADGNINVLGNEGTSAIRQDASHVVEQEGWRASSLLPLIPDYRLDDTNLVLVSWVHTRLHAVETLACSMPYCFH